MRSNAELDINAFRSAHSWLREQPDVYRSIGFTVFSELRTKKTLEAGSPDHRAHGIPTMRVTIL